jgi:drug/metabolite transporter (DMT)-like permease
MKPRDIIDLLLLGAIWGASYPFMRISAPEFGPIALILLRVAIGAACLMPLLMMRERLAAARGHVGAIIIVGVVNSALPFVLLAYSTLHLSAGFAAILNTAAPLWGAIVAWLWLGDRLSASRIAGLAIGFAGVAILVWGKFAITFEGTSLAIAASLAGTLMYGIAGSYTKKRLTGVDSLAVAAISQVAATVVLLPLALVTWPDAPPSGMAWVGVLVLGVMCTGVAYILYFRLIANAGPARAIAVSFLIPAFALAWSALFLDEVPTPRMLAGCVVILLGTALATGMVGGRRPAAATTASPARDAT